VKPRQLDQISDSPPQLQEYLSLASALQSGEHREWLESGYIEKAEMVRAAMLARIESGAAALARGEAWGSSVRHGVYVLLRSWRGGCSEAVADDALEIETVDSGVSVSAFYRVCLQGSSVPMRADAIGLGPSRVREKWAGQFYVLMQHRSSGEGDSGSLYPVVTSALAGDWCEPERSAMRAVSEFFALPHGMTLGTFQQAIVEHREVVSDEDGHARLVVASPMAAPPGLFGRVFRSGMHVFVVDLDALVRNGALPGGWNAPCGDASVAIVEARRESALGAKTPPSGHASGAVLDAPPRAKKRPRDHVDGVVPSGRSSSVQLGMFRGGLTWVPESVFAFALSSGGVALTRSLRPQLAASEPDPAVAASASTPRLISSFSLADLDPSWTDWHYTLSLSSDEPCSPQVPPASTCSPQAPPASTCSPQAPPASTCSPQAPSASASSTTAQFHGVKFHGVSLLPGLLSFLRGWDGPTTALAPLREGATVTLFHGTSPSLALRLLREGFRRPACRMNAPCEHALATPPSTSVPHGCECQMLGFAVYLARQTKAITYAIRRGEPHPSKAGHNVGAVVECVVDLGHSLVAAKDPCPCGCGRVYSDHHGTWYSWRGFDSVFLDDGSMPATSTAEWAVANPSRVTPVRVLLYEL
jgi:hypothetical protein